MRASLDQAMGTAHGLSHNADLGCYMEYNEQVIMTLANEVKRLQAEIKLQNKDWCDDDEAIKKQALRVLPKVMIEGDSCNVPFMSEVAEMMADEIERLRAELAAAKAASVLPVEIAALGGADWECIVCVRCDSDDDANKLFD